MNRWRVNGLLSRRWIMPTAFLCVVVCCGMLAYVFVPHFKLVINQGLWWLTKPSEYCMVVTESRSDGGLWRWVVHVQDSQSVSVQLLNVDTYGYSEERSWLDPNGLTVEQAFALAHRSCARRGFLNCGLRFDPRFHYLRQMDSYEAIIVEIERFVPDSANIDDCLPQ